MQKKIAKKPLPMGWISIKVFIGLGFELIFKCVLGCILGMISYCMLWGTLRKTVGVCIAFVLEIFGWRRDIIIQNLRRAIPYLAQRSESGVFEALSVKQKDPETVVADLRHKFYQHFGQLVAELFLGFGAMPYFVKKHARFVGLEHLKYAKELKKGVVVVVNHLGNWEVMTAAGSLLAQAEILMVTKRLRPAWFHRLVEGYRKKIGCLATYEPEAMRAILTQLKQGKSVGVITDQYLGPPYGIRVKFFGARVGTSALAATLALKTGASVLIGFNRRLANGDYEVGVEPVDFTESWEPGQSQDRLNQPDLGTSPGVKKHLGKEDPRIHQLTQVFVHKLEDQIARHPEQWLWSHRRFKGDLS
jgi:lauroyl/myristoyl acyltransferase